MSRVSHENEWHLDAISSQIKYNVGNFNCHPKTSVTQFPLPLEIECHSFSGDSRSHMCLNQLRNQQQLQTALDSHPKQHPIARDLHSTSTQKLVAHVFAKFRLINKCNWDRSLIKHMTLKLNRRCITWTTVAMGSWIHSQSACTKQQCLCKNFASYTSAIWELWKSLGVSLFSLFNEATLNQAFTVTNSVCHAQYCF